MSQLKIDFKTLREEWILKPSKIDKKYESSLSEETKEILLRYRHLLLNKLFLDTCRIKSKWTAQPTWINNWKKEFLQKHNINWLSKEIISYPLEEIYFYIKENLSNLKWKNIKQIDVAKNFWISNLGTFYRIVKALWLLKKLNWKLINLPVKKFELLNIKIKNFLIKNDNKIEWKDTLKIWKEIWINNPEIIYSWISALWISEEYNIHKLKITSIDLVEEIISYVKDNYNYYHTFKRNDIDIILKNFNKELWNNKKTNISKITSLLRFYWYNIEDIREYRK